jgi:hypothetical protein
MLLGILIVIMFGLFLKLYLKELLCLVLMCSLSAALKRLVKSLGIVTLVILSIPLIILSVRSVQVIDRIRSCYAELWVS